MIEIYIILTGKYDVTVVPKLQLATSSITGGNFLMLATLLPKYDTCKYSFTVRSATLWNSLPIHVIEAKSVNSFNNRLVKLNYTFSGIKTWVCRFVL